MLALLASALAIGSQAVDHSAMIGLRDRDGAYRTVYVATHGVAFVSSTKDGWLFRPLKTALHRFRTTEQGLEYQGALAPLKGTFRVSWVAEPYIGLEFDAAKPGEEPYKRLFQRVFAADGRVLPLKTDLNRTDAQRFTLAAQEALAKAGEQRALGLSAAPDPQDWGYVRDSGKWLFVSAFASPTDRLEFAVQGKPPTMNPPFDRCDLSWQTVRQAHADATDVVADRGVPFAVVVTPDFLYVHEATRTSLGRVVKRISAHGESVVSAFWEVHEDDWRKAGSG